MSVSRARCSVSTQRACGARCEASKPRISQMPSAEELLAFAPAKLGVPKNGLAQHTTQAGDDLRLSFESTISRWKCTRPGALQEIELKSNVDAFGRTTRCAFPNRFTALQQAIRLLWRITHIERSCCHSRDQDSGACQLARLLLTCLTVIMQRNCVVGSVCCSEDTSLRGPNVFKS